MKNSSRLLPLFASLALAGFALVGLALVGTLSGGFWLFAPSLPPLTDTVRQEAQANGWAHAFARLSEGVVHYRIEGPQNAPTILLIHGFQTPGFVWEDHIRPLAEAGYQVISFDNYGRGLSDRPDGAYTLERTNQLIEELLDHLNITRPLHLAGYSMGGITAAYYSMTHPQKIRSLTLIAPAGTGSQPWTTHLLAWPWVGDRIMEQVERNLGPARAAKTAAQSPNPEKFHAHWAASAGYDGNSRALLSTLRNYPLWNADDIYHRVGQTDLPVQIIWGEQDTIVPFSEATRLQALLPRAALHTYAAVGHEITYATPGLVTPHLLHFVESHRLRRASSGLGGKARSPAGRLEALDCLCHMDQTGPLLTPPVLSDPSSN